MSLEAGTYIGDLVPTNPAGTDPKSQGDDHLRLLKQTLQNQFGTAIDGSVAVPGQIESKVAGFKFPDATVQISAGYTKAEIDSRTGPGTIAASCVVTVSVGVPTKNSSYNVGVVGRPSVGLFNVTLDPPLPNDRAAVTVNATNLASGIIATVSSLTTSNVGLAFYAVSGLPADPSGFSVMVTRQP